MTQGIQHSTRSCDFTTAGRPTVKSTARPEAGKRSDVWFVEALRRLARAIVPHRDDEVPDALIDDVSYGTHTHSQELRSEFNRLDAQLHARIY